MQNNSFKDYNSMWENTLMAFKVIDEEEAKKNTHKKLITCPKDRRLLLCVCYRILNNIPFITIYKVYIY